MKSSILILRLEDSLKRTLEEAAHLKGQTLTTFVLAASLKAAAHVKAHPPAKGRFSGVPTYFRLSCEEARRGGNAGYDLPAYHLAMHLADLQPYDLECEEWQEELDRFADLFTDADYTEGQRDAAIWKWLEEHFPKCLVLIPQRRRSQFLQGIYQAYESERIELQI